MEYMSTLLMGDFIFSFLYCFFFKGIDPLWVHFKIKHISNVCIITRGGQKLQGV